jgi:prepilin-type N-terminal cleavage/methylation domain-containing protein
MSIRSGRQGFGLIEVIIVVAILGTVLAMLLEVAITATRHDRSVAAVSDVQDDAEAIRRLLNRELTQSGWWMPGSDPSYILQPGETDENSLVNDRLPVAYDDDRDARYWPKVITDRMRMDAASPAAYMALDPSVILDRRTWARFAPRMPGLEAHIASGAAAAVLAAAADHTAQQTLPTGAALEALREADRTSPFGMNRHLVWLRTMPEAWHADPLRLPEPDFTLGDSQWTDAAAWAQPRPTERWDGNATVGVAPISGQIEDATGSGLFVDLHASATATSDLRLLDVFDGQGPTTTVGSVTTPRAHGLPMHAAVLRSENGGATLSLKPMWDTLVAPEWRYRDADHDRWRDRGLFLVRSPIGLGRLVFAARVPATAATPIGVEPGQRLGAVDPGTPTIPSSAFVVQRVLSDNVARLACDTWRTIYDNAEDGGRSAGADPTDLRIRIWMARENRGEPGDALVLRQVTLSVSMRAKTSEEDRQIDRALLAPLSNPTMLW